MGLLSTSTPCPISAHWAKQIRRAGDSEKLLLVNRLLADRYPLYSAMPDTMRSLVLQDVYVAVKKKSDSYSINPARLGWRGLWEIAQHAVPVGINAGACAFTGYYVGEPIVQDVLQGRWGKAGARAVFVAILGLSVCRVVKDLFQSSLLHIPLAREFDEVVQKALVLYSDQSP